MRWQVETSEPLAQFLSTRLSESGKSVRRKLEARLCRINGEVERFGSRRLKRGDRLEIAPSWKRAPKALSPSFPQEILYEDETLLFVHKPAGFVCDASQNPKGLFWVHRLDRETTGALLFAKTKEAQEELFALFAERKVKKEYWALVDGIFRLDGGVQRTKLARKRGFAGQTIWGSSPHQGEESITHWKCLARGKDASLAACFPETGRTHQIRVHLAEMGHPILGDRQYARKFRCSFFAERVFLHAKRLSFVFRDQEYSVEAALPEDMQRAIALCVS